MEKRRIKIFFFLSAFFIATFYAGTVIAKQMDIQKIMTVTQQDNGKEISLKTGDEFKIELKELGSAGYSWHVDNLDKEHLELVSKETMVISEGKVGAPVMAVWLFIAKKKGGTEIKMDLYRVWEGKEKATEHFSIKLIIE